MDGSDSLPRGRWDGVTSSELRADEIGEKPVLGRKIPDSRNSAPAAGTQHASRVVIERHRRDRARSTSHESEKGTTLAAVARERHESKIPGMMAEPRHGDEERRQPSVLEIDGNVPIMTPRAREKRTVRRRRVASPGRLATPSSVRPTGGGWP